MNRSVLRGIVLIVPAAAIVAVLIFLPKQKPVKKVARSYDPWVLASHDPDNKYGTYLGNGLISTRIMGDGVGSQDAEPLPCFMAGLYDNEKLIPTPTWSDLRFYDDETRFVIDKKADYRQTLNMKTGILTTHATWRAGRKRLVGKIEVIVFRSDPSVGMVRARFTSNFDGAVSAEVHVPPVDDSLPLIHGESGQPHSSAFFGNEYQTRQSRIPLGLAIRLSRPWRFKQVGQAQICYALVKVRRDQPISFTSYASLATGGNTAQAAWNASARLTDVEKSPSGALRRHKAAWAKLWKKDIIIEGPKRDQQAVHSCMFYLLQSVREGSEWSIPPMGLSNNAFSGHVFWDADTWMFPALILQHPELARSIVDYRYHTLSGAIANAKASGYKGAEYAWESGYTGKEDTPPGLVYRHERHINGDVALAQWQYFLATVDLDWLKTRGYPVIKATADYWVSRAKYVPEKGRHEIHQVVPPDENAELVNNSAYTNAIAKLNLQIAVRAARLTGDTPNRKWMEVADKLYIPFDPTAKRFIAFDGYEGDKAKQADTELLIYPLQYRINDQDMTGIYANTFAFYAPKVMPKGPAMSSSAHSVIAARLGNCDKSYTEFVDSYKPFFMGPFNYFNEKNSVTYENMCFLTGAAGPIQSILFGIGGLGIDYFPPHPSRADLSPAPCLPKQWKRLKITGIQWQGKTYDLTVSHEAEPRLLPESLPAMLQR